MRRMRTWLARLLLPMAIAATAIRLRYLGWLFFRWSLILAPAVTDAERRAAVQWWDKRGYLWGFCRWPEPLEHEAQS